MTTYSLTLRDEHARQLRDHLVRPDGREHAAYILCNRADVKLDPWDRQAHVKYACVKVLPVPDDQVIESRANLITWQTASFVAALKTAAANGQVVGVVHSHPSGVTQFSAQDDANEPDLVQLAVNRNGEGTQMLSLILTADGQFRGRVWLLPTKRGHEKLRVIRVLGERIALHYAGRGRELSMPSFQRQALAFGDALNQDLRQLRASVIGAGGTGSAVAMLLARLGVGQLALIDNDIVDQTNLNRLHGAGQSDADAMRPKVQTVANSITAMGLGVRVVPIEAWVGDPTCRDALRSSDVIFGCTDDHEGRLFLNRFGFYYLTPVIDMGLAIDVGDESSRTIKALDGRVTVLAPGHTCLLCRGVIDPEIARAETMKRTSPEEYEQRKAEAYVAGEGNANPAVVTFTTELACMAVNELIHRLQGFRGDQGSAANRVRKFHLGEDRRPGHTPSPSCPLCAGDEFWGRGDTTPFLGRID
jgi:molybdopterin/thiamine biosynthesis adenylyltransferase